MDVIQPVIEETIGNVVKGHPPSQLPTVGLVLHHEQRRQPLPLPRIADHSPLGINPGELFSGRASETDGVADEVVFSDAFSNATKGTIAIYAQPASGTEFGVQQFIGSTSFRFSIVGVSNVIYFSIANGDNTFGSVSLTTNDWRRFILCFDGAGATDTDRLYAYINGIRQTLAISGPIPTSLPNFSGSGIRFGRNAADYIAGNYSNLEAWSEPWTDAEALFDFENPELLASDEPSSLLDSRGTLQGGDLIIRAPITDGFSDSNYNLVFDISGNANHGTNAAAGAAWIDAVDDIIPQNALRSFSQYSYFLRSNNNKVDIPDIALTGEYTYVFWAVFSNSTLWWQVILGGTLDTALYIPNAGSHLYIEGASVRNFTDSIVADNKIHHVVYTRNASNVVNIFVDKVKDSNEPTLTGSPAFEGFGGRSLDDTENIVGGILFEVALFPGVSFVQADVDEAYNNGVPINLLSHSKADTNTRYWRDKGHTDWPDLSTNASDGTMLGTLNSFVVVPEGLVDGKNGLGFPLNHARNLESLNLIDNGGWYVDAGQDISLQPASGITLAQWIYFRANTPIVAGIIETPTINGVGGAQLVHRPTNIAEFSIYDGIADQNIQKSSIGTGVWLLIFGSWDSVEQLMRMALNGVDTGQTQVCTDIFYGAVTDGLRVAKRVNESESVYANIGATFMYNRKLTSIEHMDVFEATKAKYGIYQ